jgi:hypothetical protein
MRMGMIDRGYSYEVEQAVTISMKLHIQENTQGKQSIRPRR